TVIGRGARDAEPVMRSLVAGDVDLRILGLVEPQEVSEVLSEAHAQLFVRSGISSRRGTVVAGIACGLPVVAYAGSETGYPLLEAGVRLARSSEAEELAKEMTAVLRNEEVRQELSARSRGAAERYFNWRSIAGEFLKALEMESGR